MPSPSLCNAQRRGWRWVSAVIPPVCFPRHPGHREGPRRRLGGCGERRHAKVSAATDHSTTHRRVPMTVTGIRRVRFSRSIRSVALAAITAVTVLTSGVGTHHAQADTPRITPGLFTLTHGASVGYRLDSNADGEVYRHDRNAGD